MRFSLSLLYCFRSLFPSLFHQPPSLSFERPVRSQRNLPSLIIPDSLVLWLARESLPSFLLLVLSPLVFCSLLAILYGPLPTLSLFPSRLLSPSSDFVVLLVHAPFWLPFLEDLCSELPPPLSFNKEKRSTSSGPMKDVELYFPRADWTFNLPFLLPLDYVLPLPRKKYFSSSRIHSRFFSTSHL